MKKILYSLLLVPALFASSPKIQPLKSAPSSEAQSQVKAEKEKAEKVKGVSTICKVTRQLNNTFNVILEITGTAMVDNEPVKSIVTLTEDASGKLSGSMHLTHPDGGFRYASQVSKNDKELFEAAKALACSQMKDSETTKEFKLS